jgi:hypothetical protein
MARVLERVGYLEYVAPSLQRAEQRMRHDAIKKRRAYKSRHEMNIPGI